MAQKVVLKVLTMTDDKTKQKAIEAAADIYGVDSITAELKDQKLTVIGEMDTVAVVKKLKKVGPRAQPLIITTFEPSKCSRWVAEQNPGRMVAQGREWPWPNSPIRHSAPLRHFHSSFSHSPAKVSHSTPTHQELFDQNPTSFGP
ncbi:hypothetical protein E3N88_22481 [Mikania micrantha]|uniref:HMA domain-containing protein n=1 Tax=Mikania micrantha TaxID=192012 RepID=A0A5N6NCB9_9ASTR|nr:hypothetical protein E3N88_22481 [Mikania micrantha]